MIVDKEPSISPRQEFSSISSSYSKWHSTIGARTFLFEWPQDDAERVDSIPVRVHQLVQHFHHNPQHASVEERAITMSFGDKDDPMEARRIALTAAVVESAPSNVWTSFQSLFEKIIKVHMRQTGTCEDVDSSLDMECEDELLIIEFNEEQFYQNLQTLQWLNPFNLAKTDVLTSSLHGALYRTIRNHVTDKIACVFNNEADDLFSSLISWKDSFLLPLLGKMLCCKTTNDDLLVSYDRKLNQTISECYCSIRSSEIFDIIADYPDSLAAVMDLHKALSKAQKVSTIVRALKESFRNRLLHPGAQTGQILQMYMNTIKVMRVFDPSDSLLDTAAEEVRAYLRGRSDTVRCIMTSLMDDQAESDLYEELQRHDAIPLDQAQYDSDDDNDPPDLNWTPAPSKYYQRISGVMGNRVVDKNADLLAMMVRIYGSNDLFVDEYRLMLADKLLASTDFDTEKDIHNLELLKLRFGEMSMRQCEIMIKDMEDSKRITSNIHSMLSARRNNGKGPTTPSYNREDVVNAAIISHIFWPPLQKEAMTFHPKIQAKLDEFSNEYAKYKKPRRLVWFQHIGQVNLELEVIEEDGEITTKEFTCSPLHATLISHFEDNDGCWTLRALSNETGVSDDIVKKRMGYWVNNKVVKVTHEPEMTYQLLSHYDTDAYNNNNDFYEDDDRIIVSLSGQEEEEWEVYESYVVGMLSNLGQLPLDRIHNMLKTFVTGSEHKYNKTPQQLSMFLQKLCNNDKLECGADGMYKLIKK